MLMIVKRERGETGRGLGAEAAVGKHCPMSQRDRRQVAKQAGDAEDGRGKSARS